jgi:hypothetical protein
LLGGWQIPLTPIRWWRKSCQHSSGPQMTLTWHSRKSKRFGITETWARIMWLCWWHIKSQFLETIKLTLEGGVDWTI